MTYRRAETQPAGVCPTPAYSDCSGLLALGGRWGSQARFWLPAALTWIGSGALVAFDGRSLLLFLILRPDASEAGWSLTDTVVALKVVIGALVAVVGALAVTVAAKDSQTPA